VTVDAEGRLHVKKLDAVPDPPSLVDLRNRVQAMLPRVDLPEVILEVMAWHPDFAQAFTSVSGGQTRLADLHVTIAAALTAAGCEVHTYAATEIGINGSGGPTCMTRPIHRG